MQQAAIVARVRIRAASPVELAGVPLGEGCGLSYVGEVLESFKGPGGVIRFAGPALPGGGEPGAEYLVFLLRRSPADARLIRQALGWMSLEATSKWNLQCRVQEGYFLPEVPQFMLPMVIRRDGGVERRELVLASGANVGFCAGQDDEGRYQPSRYRSRSEVVDGNRITFVDWDGIRSLLAEAASVLTQIRYRYRHVPEAPLC